MKWDLDADVVCTGFGAAGLATAISVVDLGGDVFVATSINGTPGPSVEPFAVTPRPPAPLAARRRLGHRDERLPRGAVVGSRTGPTKCAGCGCTDLRRAERPAEAGRTIAPFVGARLRDWTAHCLTSPYGFLHTRVRDWGTTTLHTIEGEVIEVAEIGSISPDFDNVSGSVVDWVAAQVRDRNIEIQADCSLQRIVFEEGNAIGAVFSDARRATGGSGATRRDGCHRQPADQRNGAAVSLWRSPCGSRPEGLRGQSAREPIRPPRVADVGGVTDPQPIHAPSVQSSGSRQPAGDARPVTRRALRSGRGISDCGAVASPTRHLRRRPYDTLMLDGQGIPDGGPGASAGQGHRQAVVALRRPAGPGRGGQCVPGGRRREHRLAWTSTRPSSPVAPSCSARSFIFRV